MSATSFVPLSPEATVPIVIADTETNGLRLPHLINGRRAWDYALMRREPDGRESWLEAFIDLKDLPWKPYDSNLDRVGLNIGQFYDRHPQVNKGMPGVVVREAQMAELVFEFFEPLSDAGRNGRPWLIGAVPNFEESGFTDLLHRHGLIDSEGPWNYHLLDVETYAAGRLGFAPPWSAKDMSRALGIDTSRFMEHTARGDVEWAAALYDAVLRPTPPVEPVPFLPALEAPFGHLRTGGSRV